MTIRFASIAHQIRSLAYAFLALIVLNNSVHGETQFIPAIAGDHYVYRPSGVVRSILLIAHGTPNKGQTAKDSAQEYLNRWTGFAEEKGLALVVPVFDTDRFGGLSGGYGGYRGLFGKFASADVFVISLVQTHQAALGLPKGPFFLYGHSAGGQFAVRFLVQHPDQVFKAVVTAPGRFSYPTKAARWPYGAAELSQEIVWNDGTWQQIRRAGDLSRYAAAAAAVHVIVGADDLEPQPARPAHLGTTRVDLATSWVAAMNRNAKEYGCPADATLEIVPGAGHVAKDLTPAAQQYLFPMINAAQLRNGC